MSRSPWRTAVDYVIGLAIAAVLLHTFGVLGLVAPVAISGSSMHPTLRDGTRVFVDRTAYIARMPERGDLIVFRCPVRANEFCVKRIFGLPGDTVGLIGGELRLIPPGEQRNGNKSDGLPAATRNGPAPDGFDWARASLAAQPRIWALSGREYFVVGDNRANSEDSRNWVSPAGLDVKLIVGRPIGVR